MVLVAVNFHAPLYFEHLAVHAYIEVSLAAHALKEFAVVALTITDERSQNVDATPLIGLSDHFEHLLFGVFHHLFARHIAISRTCTSEEQAQIVIDFGDGSYGGTRVLVGGLLLNADDRRKSGNLIHVRALHIAEEIAGVCGEGLYIATLTFGKDGIEGQR